MLRGPCAHAEHWGFIWHAYGELLESAWLISLSNKVGYTQYNHEIGGVFPLQLQTRGGVRVT